MTWVAGHSWVLLLLSALAGFAFTWWWMVRKIRGRVPITKEVAAVAASSGAASSGAAGASAAGASAAGAGVAAGAATLAGGTAARELKWTSETPVAERPDVEAEGPAAGVGADAPTADPDAPEVNLDDSLIGAAELDGADVDLTETDAHAPEAALSLPAGDVVAADAVAVADPLDGAEAPARVDRDTDADVDPHVGDSASARDGDTAGDTAGDDAGDSAGDSADRESEAHTETDAAADHGSDNDPVEADGESETAAAAAGLLGGTAASYAVGSFGEGSVDPLPDGSMPVGFDVKGNADSMLYHSPESPWYARTKAEVWFRDEESAAAAGFARWDSRGRGSRGAGADNAAGAVGTGAAAAFAAPSYAVGSFGEGSVDPLPDGSMPVGFDVKGNADSMLYHSPKSPWYARTKAEVWFRDEATAAAAGFKHWDPAKR